MPGLEAGQRRGARIPCDVSGVPITIRRGSGGPQKPFSWLSEGARGVFTINTEAGEQTLFPHLPSSVPPHVLVVGGAGQYRLDLSLVTFVVTLGRRYCYRVVLVIEGSTGQGQGVGGMSTRAACWLAC